MRIRCLKSLGLSIVLGAALAGCVNPVLQGTSQVSPLQLRAIQTRAYEGQETRTTLKTVLNVLQDEGFIVDYGNADLGLLHGSKTADETISRPIAPPANFLNPPPPQLVTIVSPVTIDATVNVSDFGKQIKVRVNFQRRPASSRNLVPVAAQVVDPKYYQEFFAKVERALFIQKQGL